MFLKSLGFDRLRKHTKRPYPTVIEELCHQFSLADLRKATNNFDQNNVIRERICPKVIVYRGCLQLDHVATAVVVKQMSVKLGVEEMKREIELLCQLRHPNLISLIGFCIHKDDICTVFKYMSNGSLSDHLFKRDDHDREPLSWKKRLEICIGVARGVHYLHTGLKRIIIHREIYPNNILLDENTVPKLSDFRHSLQGPLFTTESKPIEGSVYPLAGMPGFMAPEQFNFRNRHYTVVTTDKCDVYSFGMVLCEVVCAEPIYTIIKEKEKIDYYNKKAPSISIRSYIMSRLRAGEINLALVGKIAPESYEVFINIIERCLKYSWNERPAMGEVEVELERSLTLQLEADTRDTRHDYLTSITQPQQEST